MNRTVAMPLYLLRDADLYHYRRAALDLQAELAADDEGTPELDPVIAAMNEEIDRRSLPREQVN